VGLCITAEEAQNHFLLDLWSDVDMKQADKLMIARSLYMVEQFGSIILGDLKTIRYELEEAGYSDEKDLKLLDDFIKSFNPLIVSDSEKHHGSDSVLRWMASRVAQSK
jgi:hypothetical protein